MNQSINNTITTIQYYEQLIRIHGPQNDLPFLLSQQRKHLQWQFEYYTQVNSFIATHSDKNIYSDPFLLIRKNNLLFDLYGNKTINREDKKAITLSLCREVILIRIMSFMSTESENFMVAGRDDFVNKLYEIFYALYSNKAENQNKLLYYMIEGAALLGEYHVIGGIAKCNDTPLTPRTEITALFTKIQYERRQFWLSDAHNRLFGSSLYKPRETIVHENSNIKNTAGNPLFKQIKSILNTNIQPASRSEISNIVNANSIKPKTEKDELPTPPTIAEPDKTNTKTLTMDTIYSELTSNQETVKKDTYASITATPLKLPVEVQNIAVNHKSVTINTPPPPPYESIASKSHKKHSTQKQKIATNNTTAINHNNASSALLSNESSLKEKQQIKQANKVSDKKTPSAIIFSNVVDNCIAHKKNNVDLPPATTALQEKNVRKNTTYNTKELKEIFNHNTPKGKNKKNSKRYYADFLEKIIFANVPIKVLCTILLDDTIDVAARYLLAIYIIPTYSMEDFDEYNSLINFKNLLEKLQEAELYLTSTDIKRQKNCYEQFIANFEKREKTCLINAPLLHLFDKKPITKNDFFVAIIKKFFNDMERDNDGEYLIDGNLNTWLHILLNTMYNYTPELPTLEKERLFLDILNLLKTYCPKDKWGVFFISGLCTKNLHNKSPLNLLEFQAWFKSLEEIYNLCMEILKKNFKPFIKCNEDIYSNLDDRSEYNNIIVKLWSKKMYNHISMIVQHREHLRDMLIKASPQNIDELNSFFGKKGSDYSVIITENNGTSLMLSIMERFLEQKLFLTNVDKNSNEFAELQRENDELKEIIISKEFLHAKENFMENNKILNKLSPSESQENLEKNFSLLQKYLSEFELKIEPGKKCYIDLICYLSRFDLDFAQKILKYFNLPLVLNTEIISMALSNHINFFDSFNFFIKQNLTGKQKRNILDLIIIHQNKTADVQSTDCIEQILSTITTLDECREIFDFDLFKLIVSQQPPSHIILKIIGEYYNILREKFTQLPSINTLSQEHKQCLLYKTTISNANFDCFNQLINLGCLPHAKYNIGEKELSFITAIGFLAPTECSILANGQHEEKINMNIREIFKILALCFTSPLLKEEMAQHQNNNQSMLLRDLLLCANLVIDNKSLEQSLKNLISVALKSNISPIAFNKQRATLFIYSSYCRNPEVLKHLIEIIEKSYSKETVKLLLNCSNDSGYSPLDTTLLYLALQTKGLLKDCVDTTKKIFDILYANGARALINLKNETNKNFNISCYDQSYHLNMKDLLKMPQDILNKIKNVRTQREKMPSQNQILDFLYQTFMYRTGQQLLQQPQYKDPTLSQQSTTLPGMRL